MRCVLPQSDETDIRQIGTWNDSGPCCCSDGSVRVFRWSGAARALAPLHSLAAHQYPAMAADFGAEGALLLTAGMDGRACLWDVEVPTRPHCYLYHNYLTT